MCACYPLTGAAVYDDLQAGMVLRVYERRANLPEEIRVGGAMIGNAGLRGAPGLQFFEHTG